MDALSFIAKMTEAIAWPVSVIFIIVLLRKPIIELLPFLEELKYKDFALKFNKEITKAKVKISSEVKQIEKLPDFNKEIEGFLKLVNRSPRAAVVESWASLQNTLLKLAFESGEIDNIENFREHSKIGQVMLNINAFTQEDFKIYLNLKNLRNTAIHMPDFVISFKDTKDFVSLATQLSYIARERVNENT